MATIKNIIQTIFSSSGAGEVTRDINTLGRAQTRLGQSSASAGRSFASQSAGLGGLVAAYAGAAATTFALQQGFDKLAKSARAIQTIEGLNTLAANVAQDGSALLKSVQEITKAQMTLAESASQINLALSAGFDSRQIENLSEVALKASRALGRDLTDAMTRVTRGSAKMETELLDELGIYTKIEPATRAYAAALGRSVTSLSEFERRQAFVNAVITEGQRKFASINTTIPTSAEKIEAFGARILDLGLALGGFLADVVAPLADFMTNNLTASFSSFALVVSLVASKAIQVFLGAIKALEARTIASSRALENYLRIKFKIADAAKTATAAIAGLNLATFKGTQAEKAQITTLQEAAKARALTRGELIQSQALIQKNITAINAERAAYRDSIRDAAVARGKLDQARSMARGARPGDFSDPIERARNAAIRAANREIAATRPAAAAAVQALPALRAQLTQLQASYTATGAAAAGARANIAAFGAAAIAFGGKLVSNFAAGTGAVLGLISRIFFFVSIIQLAGSAIANFLGYGDSFNAFFVGIGKTIREYFGIEQTKQIKNTINGITTGTLENLEKTNQELRELDTFKFQERKILGIEFSVEKTKEDLIKDANDILTTVSTGVSDGVQDGLIKGAITGAALGAFVGPIGVAVGAAVGAGFGYFLDSSFNEIEDATSKYGDTIKKRLGTELQGFSSEAAENAVQALSVLEERMGRQAQFDPQARAAKELLETIILQSAQYSDQLVTISKIVSATGKQANVITEQFNFNPIQSQLNYIDEAIIRINDTELRLRIADEDSLAINEFFDAYSENINSILAMATGANIKGTLSSKLGLEVSGIPEEEINALANAFREAKAAQNELTLTQFAAATASSASTDLNRVLASSLAVLGDSAYEAEKILLNISAQSAPSIEKSFSNTVKTTNQLNNSLLRSQSVLADTFSGVQNGNLDLEKFNQNFSNISNSVLQSTRALPKAQQELNNFISLVDMLDPNSEVAKVLKGLIVDEQNRIDAARANLGAQKELINTLKEQEEILKRQINLSAFLKDITPKEQNPFQTALEVLKAGGTSEATSAVDFLFKNLTDNSMTAKKEFEDLRDILKSIAPALGLDDISSVLSTSAGSAKNLAASLQEAGVKVEYLDDSTLRFATEIKTAYGEIRTGTKTVSLLEADVISLGAEASKIVESLAALGNQAVVESMSLLNVEKSLVAEKATALVMASQEYNLKLKTLQASEKQLQSEIALETQKASAESQNRDIKLLEQRISLNERLVDIEKNRSDSAVDALEYELSLQKKMSEEAIRNLEKQASILDRRNNLLLKINDMRIPEKDAPSEISAKGIALRVDQAVQQFKLEMAIVAERKSLATIEFEANRQILSERRAQAEREVQAATKQYSDLLTLNQQRLEVVKAQQEIELQSIRDRIAQADNQLASATGLLDLQRTLDANKISNERALEEKKATQQYNDLIARFQLFTEQKNADSAYFAAWSQVLSTLKDTSIKIGYETEDGALDVATLVSELEKARDNSASFFAQQEAQALALASKQSELDRLKVESARQRDQAELASLESFYLQSNSLLEQSNRAEQAAAAQRVQTARQSYVEAQDNINALTATTSDSFAATEEAISNLSNSIIDAYGPAIDFMKGKIQEYRDLVDQVAVDLKSIASEEYIAEVQFKIDLEKLKRDAAMAREQFRLESLQADVNLINAKEDSGALTAMDAAKQVNDKQQEILAQQLVIENLRYERAKQELVDEQQLMLQKAMQDIESIRMSADLQKQKIAADVSYLNSLVSIQTATNTDNQNTNQELLRGLADNQTKFISVLGRAFAAGAQNIATAITSMGESTGAAYAEAIGPTMLSAIPSALGEVVTTFESSAAAASEAIQTRADAQIEQTKTQYARDIELSNERIAAVDAEHAHKLEILGKENQIETENAKSRIKSAAEAGAAEKDKADEARKKALEAYASLMDKLKDAIKAAATEIIKFVGGILTSIAQSKVDAAKAQEESIQSSLTLVTEKLNEVRSDLQSSLSDEISQRQELIELTNTLAESQAEYIKSLGSQEQKISENSDTYIDNLLKQKTAMLTLASTTQRSIALSKVEKTLGSTALSLQESLNAATDARIAAEEKLARTQAMIQGITDIVSQSFDGLGQSLINLGQAIAAVMQVTGMAGAAGISGDQLGNLSQLNNALGGLGSLVDTFAKGVKSLKVVNGNFTNAAGQTVANVDAFNKTLSTVGNVISGATSGFGIGSAIAQALGVGGFATQLGGAIGGALGAVLSASALAGVQTGIVGAVTSLVGGSAMIASAIFSIGLPIIGALIGALFSKKPKAGASVGFDEEGNFTQSSSYSQGGASSAGMVEGIQSIYTSFFSGLEAYGIELSDQAKQFSFAINSAKKSTSASFTSYGETLSQSITSMQDAATFFIDSFLKTFRLGDLIVTEATAYQENLQAAIDYFSTKDRGDRDLDVFKQSVEFAQNFDESIRQLKGPAISTADALDLISEAARVTSFQLRSYYTRFLDKTADTFGESSTQYEDATAAVRRNALAQLGLAEITTDGVTSLISLREAMENIDTGAVLVANALAGITDFANTPNAIGLSPEEVTPVTSLARELAITNLVTDVQDSLESGIALLENPASQALDTIVAVADNAATRIATVQGTYNRLIVEDASAAQLDIASNSITLARTLSDLELDAVLNSLTVAELQAVVAAEDRIDATTREIAASRLAAQQASQLAKAQVRLAGITRKLYSELLEIPSLLGIASSVPDLLELFDMSEATPFVTSLNDMINSIARGSNVSENFTSSLVSIQNEFDLGTLTADQYTDALETVTDATLEYISTIEDMVKEYEDVAKQIKSLFDSQAEQASSAAEALGTAINTLLDDFSSKTFEILKIYDKTLASVANSGNALLDLEDSAKKAFETAARAVQEFEEANRLSGKSSSSLLGDIASVQARLNELSTRPFDLSSFIEYGTLTSQLRSLKSEYATVTRVEQEYNDLLAARTSAQEDLAFATATVDSLSDSLLDTRRTESETIQKVKDAAIEYAKSQEELQDITTLLTEANFNLNQIRETEADSVRTTIGLLSELNQAFSGLQNITSSLVDNEDALRADLIASATATYEARLALASEADRITLGSLSDLQQSITEYFDGLMAAAIGISTSLGENPLEAVSQATQESVTAITAANLTISDKFSDFSDKIAEYIDFSEANSSLEAFANSLTITQNRIGVLAREDGLLSSLNSYFSETYRAIGILLSSGSFEDLSFERIRTEFGSVFTAVAVDVDNVKSAVASLSVEGGIAAQGLAGVTEYLNTFNTQIGQISAAIAGIDVSNIPAIISSISIDTSPLQGITNLVQAVNLVDTDLGTLNVTNLDNLAANITNIISGIGSSLGDLDLTISSQVSTDVATFISGLNGLSGLSIAVDLQDSVVAKVKTYIESIGEVSIANIDISANLRDSAVAAIETYIDNIGANTVQFTISGTTLSGNAILAIRNYLNGIASNNIQFTASGTVLSGNAILAIQNYLNGVATKNVKFTVTGTTLSGNAILAIQNYLDGIAATNFTFTITTSTLSNRAILAVNNYLNGIGTNNSTFNITGNTLSGNAILAVRNYLNGIGTNNAQFSITGNTLSDNAILAVRNYLNGIGSNAQFSITGNTLSDNAILAVTSYLNGIGSNAQFSITGNTLSDNAILAVTSYLNGIGANSTTFALTGNTLSNNAILAVRNYLNGIGTNNTQFSIAGNTLSGNAILAVRNYLNGIATNNSTFTLTGNTLSNNAIQAINSYLNDIANYSNSLSINFTGSGIANNIGAFVSNLLSGTGISVWYNLNDTNSLPSKIRSFVNNVTAGTGINFTYSGTSLATNTAAYIETFKTAVSTSMSGIAGAFSSTEQPVRSLITAILGIKDTATGITTTEGLVDAINSLVDGNGVSLLTFRFSSLKSTLDTLNGNTGTIETLKNNITNLKNTITAAWSNVVLTAQSTSATNPAYVQVISAGGADPNTPLLTTIAANSAKYPKITGAPYTIANFATGGPVTGPGTSTSDSIPARLSNGEYVVKASAARMLGMDTLDALNSGVALGDILAKSGRNGDSLVAHITPEEARMLKQRGGAGTRNPKTGMLEFYNKDGGAVGSVFAQQETDLLWNTYGSAFNAIANGYFKNNLGQLYPERTDINVKNTTRPWGNNLEKKIYGGSNRVGYGPVNNKDGYWYERPGGHWAENSATPFWFNASDWSKLDEGQKSSISMFNEMATTRGVAPIDKSSLWYGIDYLNLNGWQQYATDGWNRSRIDGTKDTQVGYGPYKSDIYTGGGYRTEHGGEVNGGWKARTGQALNHFISDRLGQTVPNSNAPVSKNMLRGAIDAANKTNGNFTDFYMLNNDNKGRPSAQYLTSGGLVDHKFSGSSARDSVPSMLEPGEFVLRKQAVDRMGLDAAIRLNSTGDTGGDIEVEVNINNNGTSQTVTTTPEVRRENGKIVVDIILEDLRNNGPIKRQIRSIR